MLRDFKLPRRISGKDEEMENVPVNTRESMAFPASSIDPSSRAPLNNVQDPVKSSRRESEVGFQAKIERTPTKCRAKNLEYGLPLRTPDRYGTGVSSKYRWSPKNDSSSNPDESCDGAYSTYSSRGARYANGGLVSMTPRTTRVGRVTPSYAESHSVLSTPSNSIMKPPPSIRSKADGIGGSRTGNFPALYKGVPSSFGPATIVNTVEVTHFDLKEDPSFWMDNNVQVLLRVRPLNSMEKSIHGYTRCLKQDSAQTITWIGQPETRFTFDHVACETADQEMLFRMAGLPMVENCLSGYNSSIFAYGQTGSGKTHTMLGDIEDVEVKPSEHRGMTPRIFEFLFARIQAEEESRIDEKLKYSCKCSFLEIYNEQITDLLDPTSTNLLLREDVKKGVYVENLSVYEVQSVHDILKLLIQGSLNRKVAATNMNRESSRSHSVFTCEIESSWGKDSTTNFRFARLNLVDLAGSERQKTSGAEGERLKEAANINKSLSTLGHVIMILLDVAHGKQRHVPYRDSRLTFLLQDSLGGNSKTMIIANVSPSIRCAAETLNTLKFAQRAKLIQNNAVVNEDSTGDVIALQHQIRILKDELAVLKRQNVSRSLSFGSLTIDTANTIEMDKMKAGSLLDYECKGMMRMSPKQVNYLETTLAGSLRREQMAESSIKKLEAEIEQLNCLVRLREEDTRRTKLVLRFREDKIQRMESLLSSSLPVDSFLQEENRVLLEEIQLLQTKVDKNPEVTRFASENIRLSAQLRRFQEFYEEGERDMLLDEVTNLRDQLLQFLNGNGDKYNYPNFTVQTQEDDCIKKETLCTKEEHDSLQTELMNTINELEECRRKLSSCLEDNAKLSREIHDLNSRLENLKLDSKVQNDNVQPVKDSLGYQTDKTGEQDHTEEYMNLQLELDIMKIMLTEERSARGEIEDREVCSNSDIELLKDKLLLLSKQYEDAKHELKEANSLIEGLKSQQVLSVNEIDNLGKSHSHYLETDSLREKLFNKELNDHSLEDYRDSEESSLQSNFKRMQESLDKAKRLNMCFQSDLAFQACNEEERDETRRQAEFETAQVIVCMQEELVLLQKEVQDCHLREMETKKEEVLLQAELKELREKLYVLREDHQNLFVRLEEKDEEVRTLSEEWDMVACEIEEALVNGHEALADASDQAHFISDTFPLKRVWISEQLGRMARVISEKESLIEEFGNCLEDAHSKQQDLECMLNSLRGAALVFHEAHQHECDENQKEMALLVSQLNAKTSTVSELDDKLKIAETEISKASVCATVAFVIVSRLSKVNADHVDALDRKDIEIKESAKVIQTKDTLLNSQAAAIIEAEEQILCLRKDVAKYEETCGELRNKLSKEEQLACAMQQKLDGAEELEILQMQKNLSELKTGVSMLRSCMSMPVEHDSDYGKSKEQVCFPVDVNGNDQDVLRSNDEVNPDDQGLLLIGELGNDMFLRDEGSSLFKNISQEHIVPKKSSRDVSEKNVIIILMKKEIEFALECLRQAQVEMIKLHDEKEEIRMSEKQTKENMQFMTKQVLNLHATMHDFEEQSQLKMELVTRKLQTLEKSVVEAGIQWCQTNKFVELEVSDAMVIYAQKSVEATCVLAKFEEAQHAMKEADILINKVTISNDMMKLQLETLKQREITLTNETDILSKQVQELQSIRDLKDQQFKDLEKQFCSNLVETRDQVSDLETIMMQLQATYNEQFMEIANDSCCMKSLISESTRFMKSCLEDTWAEIITKDCAVSVLHLCHLRTILEAVTDLSELNIKSRRELMMCRALEGKLLADIKNNFSQIPMKEEKIAKLDIKLSTFGKNISDLELEEGLMLQRANYMESQLVILMKEIELSNKKMAESLLDQEILLKDKEDVLNSQAGYLLVNLYAKDIESLILTEKLQEINILLVVAETELLTRDYALEKLKKELIFSQVEEGLKHQHVVDRENEVAMLEEKESEGRNEIQLLLSRLNQSSCTVAHLNEVISSLEQENHFLKEVSCVNDTLKLELGEIMETKANLLNKVQELQADCEKFLKDLKIKDIHIESYAGRISVLEQENHNWQNDISSLRISSCELKKEMEMKSVELSRMCFLEEENKLLKIEVQKLKTENNLVLHDLEEKRSHLESSLSHSDSLDIENRRLQDKVYSLESCISSQQIDVDMKEAEISKLQHSQSELMEELSLKIRDFKIYVDEVNALKDENSFLTRNCQSLKEDKCESITLANLNISECISSVKSVDASVVSLSKLLSEDGFTIADKLFHLICENVGRITKFKEDVEFLEWNIKELTSENITLHNELSHKDNVLEGMLFDLRLLQESASSFKDQKDETEKMVTCLNACEEKLLLKTNDLEEAGVRTHMLEVELQKKIDMITALEINILRGGESLKLLTNENQELRDQLEDALAEKSSLEEEVKERRRMRESLELKISEMGHDLHQKSNDIDSLRNNLNELYSERDCLQEEVVSLKDRVEHAEAKTNKIEFIAQEAQELAESRRMYADKREAQVKLLEQHVKELECTVNSMENKVDSANGEAERQKLQREELELEFHAVNQQLQDLENKDTEMRRLIDEKEKDLQAALNHIESLQKDLAEEGAEIAQFKAHISELNLVAKSQDTEYKKKEQKVINLEQRLNEFHMERQGWIEDIDLKRAAIIAAQRELETFRQNGQLLETENEMVKEENSILKNQNGDLSVKLRRACVIISGVKKELSHYRASVGTRSCTNLDVEQQLNNKLKLYKRGRGSEINS